MIDRADVTSRHKQDNKHNNSNPHFTTASVWSRRTHPLKKNSGERRTNQDVQVIISVCGEGFRQFLGVCLEWMQHMAKQSRKMK